ncbi:hypothetical protein STEG23_023009 [Scotinomys teguina]
MSRALTPASSRKYLSHEVKRAELLAAPGKSRPGKGTYTPLFQFQLWFLKVRYNQYGSNNSIVQMARDIDTVDAAALNMGNNHLFGLNFQLLWICPPKDRFLRIGLSPLET